MVIQGRELNTSDIEGIRGLLQAHPEWNRTRLSRKLYALWDWRNAAGRPKDMPARTLLLKLERAGCIALPARQRPSVNARPNLHIAPVPAPQESICGALSDLQPLGVSIAKPGTPNARLVQGLLAHEHYLGARNSVGENIRYLVRDRFGRPVACALFGSAAWKCADRDAFIGWDPTTRERNLQHLHSLPQIQNLLRCLYAFSSASFPMACACHSQCVWCPACATWIQRMT